MPKKTTSSSTKNCKAKNLVIVESPAKAKTIEKILGKDFIVKSSLGHIRDLPPSGINIEIEDGSFEPTYEITPDKTKVVRELKKLAKNREVWLASDEDREGEAIAWHICVALTLDPKKTKRIVFHEITKEAILKAVKNPRTVNKNLFEAQQARRVLDRLVGYELSPVLWKKVQIGLSAGRVQSVAVRLVVDREKEIEDHNSKDSYKVSGVFHLPKNQTLLAELPQKLSTKKLAEDFLQKCQTADFSVEKIDTRPGKKSPAPPFITSTLQQEASRKLGFSVRQTMIIAQKLYEAGLITYMRTDSINLSKSAISAMAKEITKQYGKSYSCPRRYKTKNKQAEEAHEAIRPTDFAKKNITGDRGRQKLYNLIWQRAVSSQMSDAMLEKTISQIKISTCQEKLEAKGEVIKFDGFLKLYFENTSSEGDSTEKTTKNILPNLKIGQNLPLNYLEAVQVFSRPPARYSEASLVKKMESEGIGRPSTYAPTISTIQYRKYIEKETREGKERKLEILKLTGKTREILSSTKTEITGAKKNKLFPTDLGEVVNSFLVKYFSEVVDYSFTRNIEKEFDEIATKGKKWNSMIAEFYDPFHKLITNSENISRKDAMGAREIGIDPKTKKPIIARIGRYGPMIQLGETESEEKPRFASIPKGKDMKTITLKEALELFALPRLVGKTTDGAEIFANFGRFGPYIKFNSTFVSISPDDPFSITEKKAQTLIAEKKKKDAEKFIRVFDKEGISVLNGRWGPYITDGKKNAKIPKEIKDPKKLTLKECQQILQEYKPRVRKRKNKK